MEVALPSHHDLRGKEVTLVEDENNAAALLLGKVVVQVRREMGHL